MKNASDGEGPAGPKSTLTRRTLFRRLVLGGLEHAEQAGRQLSEGVEVHLGLGRDRPISFLRPPGALPEPRFAETCSRCGLCVAACPAKCIALSPGDPESGQDAIAGGHSYIIARESPCVVCDELSCMQVCPSGALVPVASAAQIRMGVARVDLQRCLRTAPSDRGQNVFRGGPQAAGEDCRICVTQCPLGDQAIGVGIHGTIEVRSGCIGCGVCEWACPTEPTSVWVEPGNRDAECHRD